MDHFVDLCLQRVIVFPVVVAQRENRDSRHKVQVTLSIHIIEIHAIAVIQHHLVPVIGMQEGSLRLIDILLHRLAHAHPLLFSMPCLRPE